AMRQHFEREAARGMPQPELTPRQRELAIEHIVAGDQVRTAIQKAKNEAVKAARQEVKADDELAQTLATIGQVLQQPERPAAQPDVEARLINNDEVDSVLDMWRYVQETKKAKQPEGLANWVRRIGGINDEGGDVRNLLGAARQRPGLISARGTDLDDVTLMA